MSVWGSKLISTALCTEVQRTWGEPAFATEGVILGDFCPPKGTGLGPPGADRPAGTKSQLKQTTLTPSLLPSQMSFPQMKNKFLLVPGPLL